MKKIAYILILLTGFLNLSCFDGTQEIPQDKKNPEIVVRLANTQLISGSTYPTSTLISDTQVLSSTAVTITIENTGREYLEFTGSPIVETGGADASMFPVTTQPSGSIAPFSFKTFQIVFTPTSAGTKTFTITIRSNDPNTGVFSVTMNADGTVAVPVQEINVRYPAFTANNIASGGLVNLGSYNVSSTNTFTFEIQNTTAFAPDITISSTNITGIDASQFSIVTPPVSPINASGSTTFVVSFTPSSGGLKQATITIANNDPDENPYIIYLNGTGLTVSQPDIEVRQGVTLYNAFSDPYEFGNINQWSSSATVIFSIKNIGASNLNLTSVSIPISPDFTLNNTTSTPVGFPNGSTDFTIQFHPTTTGLKTATVTVVSNDPDTPSYTFDVQGTGVAIPEINIRDFTDLPAGDIPSSSGTFSFSTTVGTPIDRNFYIHNIGVGNLLLTSTPIVNITPSGGAFSYIIPYPTSPIGPGLSDIFLIRYNPLTTGTHTVTVSIANNDMTGNENPYTFTVTGTATAALVPRIDVRQSGTSITEGETVDLGGMGVNAGTPLTATFTVYNTGTANLNITGVTFTGADFSVAVSPVGSWAPGASATLTVNFTATAAGLRSAVVHVASNDPNQASFDFTLTGTGMNPELNLMQDITPVANAGSFPYNDVTIGTYKDVTFTIVNNGLAGVGNTLYLTGPTDRVEHVLALDTGPGTFSVLEQPTLAYVNPSGGTATFKIRFQPAAVTGASSATFRIYSNDSNDNPYVFTLTANGTSPEIQVTQADHLPSIDVNSGDTYTEYSNFNYNVSLAQTKTFIINNTGNGNLLLTGTAPAFITITGVGATSFSLASFPTPIIGAGGATSFDITFNPVLPFGTKTATVTIYNNDLNESTYAFNIQGICEDITNPTVNITSPGALTYVNASKVITFTSSDNVAVIGVKGQVNVAGYGADLVSGVSTIGSIPGWAAALENSTITLQLQARDSVPLYGYDSRNFIKDTINPTVSVSAASVSYVKTGDNVTYTVTYTDANFGSSTLAIGDISLVTTGTAAGTVTGVAGAGNTRTVTINVTGGDGTIGISAIAAGTAVDLAGNLAGAFGVSGTFTVDNTAPTISSITTTKLDGFYKIGEVIPVTITFSENVTLGGVGNIEITLNSGGIVTIGSLTTPTTADGTYTVGAGQNSLDLTASGVSLTGTATLRDAALNDTNLALPPFGFNIGDIKNIVIDTVVPAVTGVNLPASATYNLGSVLTFEVVFSENITVANATSTLALTLDSGVVTAAQTGTTANSIIYSYTVGAGALDSGVISVGAITLNTTTVQDASANNANLAIGAVSTAGVVVDGVVPAVTGVNLPGGGAGSFITGTTITFEIIFGEALTSYGTDSTLSLTFDSGNVSAIYSTYLAGTITYSYTISGVIPDYDATAGITVNGIVLGAVPIQDAAGNDAVLTLPGTVNTITIN